MADDRSRSQTIAGAWATVRDGRLDEAHDLVQHNSSPEAAYLHGMIHREEGDPANARYWFARAGSVVGRLGFDPMSVEGNVERAALAKLLES